MSQGGRNTAAKAIFAVLIFLVGIVMGTVGVVMFPGAKLAADTSGERLARARSEREMNHYRSQQIKAELYVALSAGLILVAVGCAVWGAIVILKIARDNNRRPPPLPSMPSAGTPSNLPPPPGRPPPLPPRA